MDGYLGTYHSFETASKRDAAVLFGSDNIVGDSYQLDFSYDEDMHQAWLVSRFNERLGYFKGDFARKLGVYKANGSVMVVLLAFVAFSESRDDGQYWGNAAVICYPPDYEEAFGPFVAKVTDRLRNGLRTKLDLSDDELRQIIKSNGTDLPIETVPLPDKEKGTVIVKSRESFKESLIEQARKGNKGCYFVSWAFLLALVALLIFGLHSCGLF